VSDDILKVGKLPLEVLTSLLQTNVLKDERIIVGPSVGEDAAVIDAGGPNYLIATTDPITFTTDKIGWYVVNVNANDIATRGGRPQWFLVTMLLPERETCRIDIEKIFQQMLEACDSLGISLVGGHTEITHGLTRPILIGHMLGEVEKDRLVATKGAREGDAVILTKGIAIEGTAIIAREKENELAGIFDAELLSRAKDFLGSPGISVVRDALVAGATANIHAMHDPTEGGLATALHEIGQAADVGLVVDSALIPVLPETRMFCNYYDLDPLGLIASGALLIAVSDSDAKGVINSLSVEGIPASVIGRVVHRSEGIKVRTAEGLIDLPIYAGDELTKIL